MTADQFRAVAELTEKYSRGEAEITNRQDIQLHWIRAEDALDIFAVMDKIGFTTDMCGQGFTGARYGDARNIVCCPVSGVEKGEILDGRPLLKKLTDFLIGNPDFQDMPRKFKFSISGCGCDCTRAVTNDLAFVAVRKGEEVGFTTLVGGSVGSSLPGPRLAKPTRIFVRSEDTFNVALATIKIHRDYGSRESKAKARFKWLLEHWGLKKFLLTLERKIGASLERYKGPVFLRSGNHEGIHQQSEEGYHYVNIPIVGGRLKTREMLLIADIAERHGGSELRLTPTQNIILPNVKNVDLLLKRLKKTGFPLEGSRLRWNNMGCSSDFCGKTQSPHAKEITKHIVDHLEDQFDPTILNEAGFRIHVSGCPHNCCANVLAEIGLAGKLVRRGEERRQSYDIYLGGGFGVDSGFGRLVAEKVPAETIKHNLASLLRNYAKKRNPSETLRAFCNKHSIEELKRFLDTGDKVK